MATNPAPVFHAKASPKLSQWPRVSTQTKIVLGDLGGQAEASGTLPEDLAKRFPSLTHLHLWGLKDLEALPRLPAGLRVLDVRRCPTVARIPELPEELESLVIEDCEALRELPVVSKVRWRRMRELSLSGNRGLRQESLRAALQRMPALEVVDLSRSSVERLAREELPAAVLDLRLNDASEFAELSWLPPRLRRLELRGTRVMTLPPLPASLDFVNLRGTKEFGRFPEYTRPSRTLFLFESSIELPKELLGTGEDFNAAPGVFAHLEASRVAHHEVKVILLGNGRCGKSSLARRLVEGTFDREERSTHGIRLWTLEGFPFVPVDEPESTGQARLNLWDFAGQDLYHNAHRLFFQSKAVFVLCDTCAGDGADPQTDHTDDDELPEGWDVDRTLRYWRDQVEAVQAGSGAKAPPPILFVRTKAGRDREDPSGERLRAYERKIRDAARGLKRIDFDAETAQGLEDLEAGIALAVAQVLGRLGQREIRADALEVKKKLQLRITENDAAHRAAERGETVAPPHPTLSRSEFDRLVREHCKGRYREDPGLLLEFLHGSGFLFHDERNLPGEVILDQRWAIRGIYAALERKSAWPELRARRGLCTLEDLVRWGWEPYLPEHRRLFLAFMVSCGMAFPLGERRDGKQECVVPRALPDYGPEVRRAARDQRAGAAFALRKEMKSPSLSRDAVLDLLVGLGKEWGRFPVLWLWGGQFESFRERSNRARTFVWLNWEPADSESYGGTLTIEQYGPDKSFTAAVLERCRKVGGFGRVEIPEVDYRRDLESGEEHDLELLRLPSPDLAKAHQPAAEWKSVVVAISFAGDQAGPVEDASELPAGSIELWPLALAASLRGLGFTVEEYRTGQKRPPHEHSTDRKAYCDQLAARDFVFVFLSWPYLESPWCMYEFLRVHERCPDGKQDSETIRLGAFEEAYFSQTHATPASDPLVRFRGHWNGRLQDFRARIKALLGAEESTDPFDVQRELGLFAFADWLRCVSDRARFNAIERALHGGWTIERIPVDPGEDHVRKWAHQVEENLDRPPMLARAAKRAWKEGDSSRAARLYIRSLRRSRASTAGDLAKRLAPQEQDRTLELIRLVVRGKLEELRPRPRSWEELEKAFEAREHG